jgi:CHAD domain-containing protein
VKVYLRGPSWDVTGMAQGKALLDRSAGKAAREVASRQLEEWVRARHRMGRPKDSDVLHDFRVALRRLRSALRAFRDVLPLRPGLRRGLRRLARATNESRNLEIFREWLAQQPATMTARQRKGARWLNSRLSARQRRADQEMGDRIRRRFSTLRRDLADGPADLRGGGRGARTPKTARVIRRVVRQETVELDRLLQQVHSMRDRDPAHAARISVKRIRYLLEPFAEEISGGPALIERLRDLQTILGEVHDAHVMADALRDALSEASELRARQVSRDLLPWPPSDELPPSAPPGGGRTGLVVLGRRLRAEGDRRFAKLRSEWLGRSGAAPALLLSLRELAQKRTRTGSGRPDLNRRLPAPKAGALPG